MTQGVIIYNALRYIFGIVELVDLITGKVMPIVIKRYQNRKLYDTRSKRYITLEELEELIKRGQDIKVIDNSTGNDITAITLSQIIFELEKIRSDFLPIKLLSSLVLSGGTRIEVLRRNILNSLNLNHHYDIEIKRRVNLLVEQGELTQEEGIHFLDRILNIGIQTVDANDNSNEVIYGYLQEQKIPTKNDLKLLIQKIDAISKRVDEIYLETNNKE
jgi:polyhydroxyalkanoate synthesis repressor PhaR